MPRASATSRASASNRQAINQNYLKRAGSIIKTFPANLIVNGGMELDSNWTNYNLEGGETNERSNTRSKEGTYSRHIIVDGSWEGATSDFFNVEVGKTYRVSCWVWVVSGVARFRRNAAKIDFTLDSSTTGQWQYLSVDVLCTSSGAEKFRLEATGAAEYYVDEIKVEEINFVEEEVGAFEDITDFSVTGTGGEISADTAHYKQGTQGLKLKSVNAVSAYAIATKNFDFSGVNVFSFWLYIDDVSKMFQGGVSVVLFYTSATDYFMYSVTGSDMRTGWNRVVFQKSDCTVGNGSPDWSSPVSQIRLRALSLTGETVNLTFDDFRVGMYERPKVIISFDDANATDYTVAFPYMAAAGMKGVLFVPGDNVGQANQATLAQLKEMYAAGWDMGNHSYFHTDLTTLTDAQIKEEIRLDVDYLVSNGMPRAAFFLAWPFSALNDAAVESVRQAGIIVARTGVNGVNSHQRQERLRMRRGSVANTYSIGDLTAYVDRIIQTGGVLIYNFHDIVDPASASTDVLPATFNAVIDYIKAKRDLGLLDVVTMSEWYNGLTVRESAASRGTSV